MTSLFSKPTIASIVAETKRLLGGCVFNGDIDPYATTLIEELEQLLPLLERREQGEPRSFREDEAVGTLGLLFAPTGPLQEMSLDHGWGDAYMRLAAKADAWVEKMRSVKVSSHA